MLILPTLHFVGSHAPRSMTSTGMCQHSGNAKIRTASAKSDEQRQRPRTCPAGLPNNRLTHRSQTAHRTLNASNSNMDGQYNSQRIAHKARTSRLMALTLRSRSNQMPRPKSPMTPSGGVLITESGYRVTTSPVLASGSQRTIQLIKSVRSPQHEYRMRKGQGISSY